MFRHKNLQLTMRLFTIAMLVLAVTGLLASTFVATTKAAPTALVCKTTHVVKSNETLNSIAKKYNITVDALAKANDMSIYAKVFKGQRLCIPAGSRSETQAILSSQASKGILSLSASKLSKLTPYAIKVREGDLGLWYILGRTQSTKDGSLVAKNYSLPLALRNKIHLTVCLKNQLTDQLTCKKVYHIP